MGSGKAYREQQAEGQAELEATMAPKDERSRQQHERALNWARRNLPNEDPGFAAVAAAALKRSGQRPTAAAVLDRLESQGRDAASLAATYARHPGLFGDEA